MKLKNILPWIGELDLTKILQCVAVVVLLSLAIFIWQARLSAMTESLGGVPMPDVSFRK